MFSPYISIRKGEVFCTLKSECQNKCPFDSNSERTCEEKKKTTCQFAAEENTSEASVFHLVAAKNDKPVCYMDAKDKCLIGLSVSSDCYDAKQFKTCPFYHRASGETKKEQSVELEDTRKPCCPFAGKTRCASSEMPLFLDTCYNEEEYQHCIFYLSKLEKHEDYLCPFAKEGKCEYTGRKVVDKCYDKIKSERCNYYEM